ncbi:MAG: hypothetical protein QM762_13605 [Chryseolinea sp.]
MENSFVFFVLAGCENAATQIPNNEEISNLIVETIRQDSLDRTIPTDINVINRYNYRQQYHKELGYIPPPPRSVDGEPFVFGRYKSTMMDTMGFNENDSVFVAYQIQKNKDIVLERDVLPGDILTYNSQVQESGEQKSYQFLVPLVNKSKTFAIVEYELNCSGCGYGRYVGLGRVGDKWIKVGSFDTWRQ